MIITASPMNILDYCKDMQNGKIKVDKNYQRSDKIWPVQAKSYLIESIVLGYPIPKMFLHQKIDIKSITSIKFIVDGQQRSTAILEFLNGKFAIERKSKNLDIAGKRFDDLDEDFQNAFLSYSLPIDLFVTASREEIIETFRRINSYTVPLNSEEKRHANYQGEMKWFINTLATKYSEKLATLGVFTDKNLSRMVDYKFFSEVTLFAVEHQLSTTSARNLDKLYELYNESFLEGEDVLSRISNATDLIIGFEWLKTLNVNRPHIVQMMLYAISEQPTLNARLEVETIRERLSDMSEALESNENVRFRPFVEAASKTTNEKKRRETILKYIKWAFFNEPYA